MVKPTVYQLRKNLAGTAPPGLTVNVYGLRYPMQRLWIHEALANSWSVSRDSRRKWCDLSYNFVLCANKTEITPVIINKTNQQNQPGLCYRGVLWLGPPSRKTLGLYPRMSLSFLLFGQSQRDREAHGGRDRSLGGVTAFHSGGTQTHDFFEYYAIVLHELLGTEGRLTHHRL